MPEIDEQALSESEVAAWRGLLRSHSALIAELDAELEREHGLPLTSYEVLLQLAEAPDCSLRMGALAERLYLSRSGLTRLVDRLVKQGLVERAECESDRRGSYAQLTADGRRRFDRARPTHLAGIRRHFRGRLDESDQARLAQIWAKIAEPLG
jgi:DNA-binding MarR family transcriptional regulator